MGPIEKAYVGIMSNSSSFIVENFIEFAKIVLPVIHLTMVLLFIWSGYKMLTGRGLRETGPEMLLNLVRYAVIAAMFADVRLYQSLVMDVFQKTPDMFSGALSFKGAALEARGLMAQADQYFERGINVGKDMMSWTNIGQSLLGVIVMLASVLAGVFAVIQTAIADIGTAVFLAIGPLAFAALLFPMTRGLFEGWLRMLMTFAATKLLLIVVLGLTLYTFEKAADGFQGGMFSVDNFSYYIAFLIYTLIIVMILMRVPEFASQLGSGISLSAANMTMAAASKAKQMTGVTARGAGRAGVGGVAGYRAATKSGAGGGGKFGGALVGAGAAVGQNQLRNMGNTTLRSQAIVRRIRAIRAARLAKSDGGKT